MAVLPIRITGDPVLHSPALPVETIDDELRTLVRDLFETMDAAPGVGLAAPQVGVLRRVLVYQTSDEDPVVALVNPKVVSTSEERESSEEDARGDVDPRPFPLALVLVHGAHDATSCGSGCFHEGLRNL